MRKRQLTNVAVALVLMALITSAVRADVKLPGVFGHQMVMQRDMAIPVWGWAAAGEEVTVSLGQQTKTVTAGASGKWSVRLDAMSAGGPYELLVKGNNQIRLTDVLIGEVWLCSGQSNVDMPVRRCLNSRAEEASAKYPKIRMMTVAKVFAETPQETCGGHWAICRPDTVGRFSAVAYFFGRKLHQELDVPVGLICPYYSGTPIQSWIDVERQEAQPELRPMLRGWENLFAHYNPAEAKAKHEKQLAVWQQKAAKAEAAGNAVPRKPQPPLDPRTSIYRPGYLYNGTIAPLAPYAIRGAVWYQGETNSDARNAGLFGLPADLYGMQLQMLIENWRELWGQGPFPFIWVQLPNFDAPPQWADGWVTVREQMLKSLALENTGMAVTIDVGDADDIHPKNKQDVGKRLALWALGTTYKKDAACSGPLYRSMSKQGGKIAIEFDHLGGGLVSKGAGGLKGFAIAGADKKFVSADATIDAGKVIVSSPQVNDPIAVRYAWAANPTCNLYNKAGLPASPFRTDEWEGTPAAKAADNAETPVQKKIAVETMYKPASGIFWDHWLYRDKDGVYHLHYLCKPPGLISDKTKPAFRGKDRAAAFVLTADNFMGPYEFRGNFRLFPDSACYICKIIPDPNGEDRVESRP